MSPLRVVLVTRRFWPLVGGAERVMANLATALVDAGVSVTLLTACWERTWPREVIHRGVRVVRLEQPALRGWGTLRYMQRLARWLRDEHHEFDLVYVSMLKHDAYAALSASQRGDFPVVLRAEGAGATGDVAWQREGRCGGRIAARCRTASAIVAPSPAIQQELLGAGYPSTRVELIPNAVPIGPPRDGDARREARASLAEAHPLLSLPADAPLAVYTGRLHAAKGLSDLIAAWRVVDLTWPAARLWIVGEGPQRRALAEQIEDQQLSGRVVLCGAFDSIDDFLTAADCFVLPSHEEGMSLALVEAMAAGLPIVATDIEGNRQLVRHQQEGLLAPVGNAAALAAAIGRLLADRSQAAELGNAARRRVADEFSLAPWTARHLELFERVLAEHRAVGGR
ncbi:MAG: glycosyltransferase family 4 protein [Pirellulales bacterium]|nr:glycosyltransferase family 4 protein [Pirellulales bacterium]